MLSLVSRKSGPSELYSCQGRNDTDLSGRRIYLCFHSRARRSQGHPRHQRCRALDFRWQLNPASKIPAAIMRRCLIPAGRVWTIFHEHAGSIWVGGEGGPSKFDNDRFHTLSQSKGLPAESIFGMAEDDDGYWCIATDVGVLRVPVGADRQLDGADVACCLVFRACLG